MAEQAPEKLLPQTYTALCTINWTNSKPTPIPHTKKATYFSSNATSVHACKGRVHKKASVVCRDCNRSSSEFDSQGWTLRGANVSMPGLSPVPSSTILEHMSKLWSTVYFLSCGRIHIPPGNCMRERVRPHPVPEQWVAVQV